ncbi:HAD-IA family hydrolase [Luteococcus peritonei]|uniref:HAD family hydrolase n=1 Tax=Luteococcus peritonei TaxID=88874 RepID=A0ABW4RTZ5_9ACTN
MTAMPRWKTVVFDLDGTLCDTVALILASFRHAHATVLGEELDEAEARTWIGRTLNDIYAGTPDRAEELATAYVDFNLANLEQLQTDVEGISQMLDALRDAGVSVGVATSKRRPAAERSLAASGITDKVQLVSTLEDVTEHKPHPAPLLHALTQLGAEPGEAVYVGDAIYDVQAAKAAGMDQIAVTWGAGDRTALMLTEPTAVVDSVDELERWLLGPVG